MTGADKELIEQAKQAIADTKSLIAVLKKHVKEDREMLDTTRAILKKQEEDLRNLEVLNLFNDNVS